MTINLDENCMKLAKDYYKNYINDKKIKKNYYSNFMVARQPLFDGEKILMMLTTTN